MKRLAIIINQDEFVLHGSGSALALRGCQRHPSQRLPSGLSLEKLDLIVQGTATQTRALISQLQMLVERMRLGHSAWLALQPDDSAAVYHSRLYAADFNWILGSVQAKGIGIRLELHRQDFWQLPWQPLALNNSHGNAVTDGLQIDNRADGAGQNWCWIAGEGLLGDLPAPVRLQLQHDLNPAESLDQIMLGWGSAVATPLAVLEGESADSLLNFGVVMNSSCHAGAYGLVQWDNPDAIRVLSWVLPGSAFAGMAGRQVRPLVRLVNPTGLRPETWLSWKLYHGRLVFQSGTQLLSLERELQLLPMICLPNLSNVDVPWSDLRLELYAHNRNPGTTHLALDAVFLFFTDGWRQFAALPDGELAFGQTLIDAVDQEQPYIHLAQTQKNQHAYQGIGNGLWLLPGEDHVLQMMVDVGLSMPLGMNYHIQLEYQPRRRMLP
jgi:hypothetical protein